MVRCGRCDAKGEMARRGGGAGRRSAAERLGLFVRPFDQSASSSSVFCIPLCRGARKRTALPWSGRRRREEWRREGRVEELMGREAGEGEDADGGGMRHGRVAAAHGCEGRRLGFCWFCAKREWQRAAEIARKLDRTVIIPKALRAAQHGQECWL